MFLWKIQMMNPCSLMTTSESWFLFAGLCCLMLHLVCNLMKMSFEWSEKLVIYTGLGTSERKIMWVFIVKLACQKHSADLSFVSVEQ